jgi:hypothetical protein
MNKENYLLCAIVMGVIFGVNARNPESTGVMDNDGEMVWIEAESFSDSGGWLVDQQSMDQMGSPYMLAHGLGHPVNDAVTTVSFKKSGEYRVWVRTRDWVAPWKTADTPPEMKAVGCPGKFQLIVNGRAVPTTFGTEEAEWHWQDGGVISVAAGDCSLALHDLTGFDGRCDAIFFSRDLKSAPGNRAEELSAFRRKMLGFPEEPRAAGEYDLVVAGGGVAGCCLAVSAARQGCRVALVQNRPVLGGNNSSEVRVGLSGLIYQEPYKTLGSIVDEIGPIGHWNLWEAKRDPDSERSRKILQVIKEHPEKKQHNAGPLTNYEDQRKIDVVQAEKNISLFLNTHVNGVVMDDQQITAVIGEDIRSGERLRFNGRLFADCTGDGNLGALAGADFRVGRESRSITQEKLAPEKADQLVMGTSVQWYSRRDKELTSFPVCSWAVSFNETNCIKATRGDWDWETGASLDQVTDIEQIRDYALRVTFGNWSVLKNSEKFKKEFKNRELEWVAYIGGKRESRRLLGDVILRQQDLDGPVIDPDACVTTTWSVDLHYPKESASGCEPFRSVAKHHTIKPYAIPYRTMYSRNVDNLMMAGRNISVTHVALGTVRVMRTTGMMGEALGFAAGLCAQHNCNPRDVYEEHLAEFKELLSEGIPGTEIKSR